MPRRTWNTCVHSLRLQLILMENFLAKIITINHHCIPFRFFSFFLLRPSRIIAINTAAIANTHIAIIPTQAASHASVATFGSAWMSSSRKVEYQTLGLVSEPSLNELHVLLNWQSLSSIQIRQQCVSKWYITGRAICELMRKWWISLTPFCRSTFPACKRVNRHLLSMELNTSNMEINIQHHSVSCIDM